MIVILLTILVLIHTQDCPVNITDELELIAQPLNCFRKHYNHTVFDNHKILHILKDRLQIYQKMLQQLRMSQEEHLQTTPVIKWAQSNNQIFISFKLSHRQDSPTCSDVRTQFFQTSQIQTVNSDIPYEFYQNGTSNISKFNFIGQCYFTSQKFWFKLHLQFGGNLTKLVLRKEGLGLYILIGDKAEPNIWVPPFNNFKSAAIWPELRSKYNGDMDKYFKLTQEQAQSQHSTRRRSKKRRKPTQDNEL